jgi:membrane peptidoglycan carboxypeptidase
MTHSINTVFAQLTLQAGPENVMRTAETLGVPDVEANVAARPAVGLGGLRKGVTPLEQAAAFATFAAKGIYAQPYSIVRVVDRHGDEVHRRRPATRRAFSANEVGVLNAALSSVVTQGTGRAADIGRPAAGKTGTTQNHGDAWFVGFVPQLSTAVWMGHPQQVVPMVNVHGRRVSGGSFPAEIWAAYMRRAVETLPVQDLHTAAPESLSLHVLTPPPPPPPPPPPAPPPTVVTVPPPVEMLPLPPPQTVPPAPVVAPPARPRPGSTSTTTVPTTTTTKASKQ